MANEGFNTFVLGQPPAASAAATDSVPLIQAGSTSRAAVSTITPYYLVGPTGGDDTAMLNSAFANSPSRPVMLSFGQYNVSGPLTVPDYGVVLGAGEINLNDYWHNRSTPRINLVLNPTNSFVNGQAAINMGNYSHVKDFSIVGLRNYAGHAQVNGVNIKNKAYSIVEGLYITLCYDGINGVSDGSVSGGSPWGNNSIGNVIRGCFIGYSEEYGFYSWGGNGGYFSDAEITQLWCGACNAGAVNVGSGFGNSRFVNCRIEDQGSGIHIMNTGAILMSGCLFDRNGAPITIDNSLSISITGCMSTSAGNNGSGSGGTGTHVFFKNSCANIQLAGNVYNQGAAATSYTYGVQSAGTVSGAFCEGGGGNTVQYQDAYSQSVIAPLMVKLGP
jgi:hypothetical protein